MKYGALKDFFLQGKTKSLKQTLSQCHSVHHKRHMDWHGIEPGVSVVTSLPAPWHSLNN
jgi:hypothetical protein